MSWKRVRSGPWIRSLRARLVAGYTLVLLLSITGLSAIFYVQVKHAMMQAAREFLKSEYRLIGTLFEREGTTSEELSRALSRRMLVDRGPYPLSYALYDRQAHLVARSEGFTADEELVKHRATVLADREQPLLSERRDPERGTVLLVTGVVGDLPEGSWYLQLGLPADAVVQKPMASIRQTLLILFPLVLVVVIGGGLWLTTRLLAPVSKLNESAKALSLTDLGGSLPIQGTGDELDELAMTFNQAFRRLRDSYQRVVQFTADASHELRLPITAMKGEAEVVLERERSVEEYRKVLTSVIEEMDRLSRMTGHLLQLARSDSGADRLTLDTTSLGELLRGLVGFYEPLTAEKRLHVTVRQDGPAELVADRSKLSQLFSNLLENAIKYTPEGGRVELVVKGSDTECRVDVCDTGVGIAPEEHGKIFERFYRVDKSRSRTQGGSGLGLSIAESIATAHGGRITVESAPGKGSRFSVTLPRRIS